MEEARVKAAAAKAKEEQAKVSDTHAHTHGYSQQRNKLNEVPKCLAACAHVINEATALQSSVALITAAKANRRSCC